MRRNAAPTTVDEYLARLDGDQRSALQRLRRTIRSVIPGAEECISYQLPAFRFEGKVLVWFGAAAHHCAFYPGAVVESFADELKAYDTSKGTIRFTPDDPLPVALVRKIVNARIAQRRPPANRGAAQPAGSRASRGTPARRTRPRRPRSE